MKDILTPRRSLAVAILLGATVSAGAQSLGAPRAELFIGRPLDLSVPARLANGDARDDCVHADVFYGDARVPASQVRTRLAGPRDDRRIHVQSDTPIDEPMVTVALRAGCNSTVTRSYTLLPEAPSAAVLASGATRAAGAAPVVAAAAPAQPAVQRTPRAAPARQAVAARAPQEAAPRVRAARAQPPNDNMGRPRLRLEMWEPEPQALLRTSSQLTPPSQDLAHRASAALLWRALNADPQEILRTGARLQQLEKDVAQLRTTAQQTSADMAAVRRYLEAPPAQGQGQLVQLLMLLLVAAAAGASYYWYRSARAARAGAWYQPHVDAEQPAPVAAAPAAFVAVEPQPVAAAEPAPTVPTAPLEPAAPVAVEASAAEPFAPEPPDDLDPAHRHTLRVETLAATFEEVEFLCSLGLWDDAKDVLKTYLEDSTAPAPLAFFELMRLCVHSDDAAALAAVRRRYVHVFGVEAPQFEQLAAPLGLESQPVLSTRITRAWGKPEALDLIEQSLFTVPPPGKVLSLQAGRDLIGLFSLAQALAADAQAAQAEADHELAPWADSQSAPLLDVAVEAPADRGLGLDLDLNVPAPQPEPAAQEVAPEMDLELEPLLAEFEAAQARRAEEEARAAEEAEAVEAFSAAVASEPVRRPALRH